PSTKPTTYWLRYSADHPGWRFSIRQSPAGLNGCRGLQVSRASPIESRRLFRVREVAQTSVCVSGGKCNVREARGTQTEVCATCHQSGNRTIFTRSPSAIDFVPAGTMIKTVARAKATKSDEPPHFNGSASRSP